MRLRYDILVCIIALRYSSAAAVQPRPPLLPYVRNITASSSSVPTLSVCHPVTSQLQSTGDLCISYCATRTFYSFALNATSTITTSLTVYGNSTSYPISPPSTPPASATLPPQPCPVDIPNGCAFIISLVTSKTTVVTKTVSLPPPVCYNCTSVVTKTVSPPPPIFFNHTEVSISKDATNNVAVSATPTPAPSPSPDPDHVITAGGITFSEIRSSLVVLGGSTFTIGPGATPTTDVVNGQTVSIGPGGVGFASTTVPYSGGVGSAGPTVNGAGGLGCPRCGGFAVVGILAAVWFLV